MLTRLIHLVRIWKSAVDRPQECEITAHGFLKFDPVTNRSVFERVNRVSTLLHKFDKRVAFGAKHPFYFAIIAQLLEAQSVWSV